MKKSVVVELKGVFVLMQRLKNISHQLKETHCSYLVGEVSESRRKLEVSNESAAGRSAAGGDITAEEIERTVRTESM